MKTPKVRVYSSRLSLRCQSWKWEKNALSLPSFFSFFFFVTFENIFCRIPNPLTSFLSFPVYVLFSFTTSSSGILKLGFSYLSSTSRPTHAIKPCCEFFQSSKKGEKNGGMGEKACLYRPPLNSRQRNPFPVHQTRHKSL